MRARTKLWITLLSPLVGLLLAEGAARALELQAAPLPRAVGLLFRPSWVRGLTYENRPGAERRVEYRDTEDGEPRVVLHRVNGQGFRGPEVAQSKPPGTYRIACLGDSHTFGTGVAEHETWPVQLQALLERRTPELRVEVLNCGVSAYDTEREVILLRERVLKFDPDLVLLQFHVNDVGARNALGWKSPPDDWLLDLSHPRRGGWIGRLRSTSTLAHWCLDRLHAYRGARDEAGLSMDGYAPNSPGWLKVRTSLRAARDLTEERSVAFAVVLFPYLLRVGPHLSSHAAFEQVADLCRREGIPYLDAENAFEGVDATEMRVHVHDFHANARAYGIFARAVDQWLAERGLPAPAAAGPPPMTAPATR